MGDTFRAGMKARRGEPGVGAAGRIPRHRNHLRVYGSARRWTADLVGVAILIRRMQPSFVGACPTLCAADQAQRERQTMRYRGTMGAMAALGLVMVAAALA